MTSDEKKAERTRKNTLLQAAKRRRDAKHAIDIRIPIKYQPTQHLLYDPSHNIVGYLIVQYLGSLQKNDVVARPTTWTSILLDTSVQKKHGLSLGKATSTNNSVQSHLWKNLDSNRYSLANTELEFKTKIKASLILLIIILPNSELSLAVAFQHAWSGQSLDSILDSMFEGKKYSIEVQDHGLASLRNFTVTKTSDIIRSRFSLYLKDRGCPWNCLEVDDRLPGFKGPQLLEFGGSLLRWQLRNPKITNFNQSSFDPVRGGKFLDQ